MEFCYDTFQCTYVVIKEMVSKQCLKRHECLVSTIALILTIAFLAIEFLLVFPWFIWHLMLKRYLEFRYRDNFGGLLSINTLLEHAKITITVVYILEHHGSDQQLLMNVKTSCQNLMRSHYRFTSTVRKCCGYYYFLKDQVSIDDVISVAEEKCTTKTDLVDYLRKNCLHRLDGGAKLWSVKVFKNPITWNGHSETRFYPIVITYNHCLADAICLGVFQHKHLLGDVIQTKFENALRKSTRSKGNLMKSNVLQFVTSEINRSLLFNPENPDQNIAVFIEEKPKYLELVRELSKHFQCTFTDILLITSVIVLTEYMEEKNILPRNVCVGHTCRNLSEDTSALLDGRIFDNVVGLDLYVLPNIKCKNVLEKFLKLKEVLNTQRNSTTSQLLYANRIIMSYLPAEVLLRLWRSLGQRSLLALTNIPGADFARVGGAVVRDAFVFVNYGIECKFIVVVHSHGGRLQVSLISERCAITSKEDLQKVLNKVFEAVDNIYEQSEVS